VFELVDMHSMMSIVLQNQKLLRIIFSLKSTFYAQSRDQFYGQIDHNNNNLLESNYYQSCSHAFNRS